VVRNWNREQSAQLELNQQSEPNGPNCRQGVVRDPNGRLMLVVWLQRQGTEPISLTLRGARPELASLPAMAWTVAPQAVSNSFDITMSATPLSAVGIEYCFERTSGAERSFVWQSTPSFTDVGLPPDTDLAYRVKGRNAYSAETEWSAQARAKTPPAPAPVIWPLDEGQGTAIKDTSGAHEGLIHGNAVWVTGVAGTALHLDGKGYVQLNRPQDLSSGGTFTWMAWIRTTQGGTILARSGAGRAWQPGGKVMFVANGRLRFDVGWVGDTGAGTPVADGQWHHVAVAVAKPGAGDNVQCFVDGRQAGRGHLEVAAHPEAGLPVRIGFCNDDFPRGQSGFVGDLDEIRWYAYPVGAADLEKLYRAGKSQRRQRRRGGVPAQRSHRRDQRHLSRLALCGA
jgi:hypothetical protein